MAAAVVGTTVAVTYTVQNHHHTLVGCVFTGPGGMQLRRGDATVFSLEGETAAVKAGERVKLHGSKVKQTKDSTGKQVFLVEKVKRDYGPCAASAAAAGQ